MICGPTTAAMLLHAVASANDLTECSFQNLRQSGLRLAPPFYSILEAVKINNFLFFIKAAYARA